MIDELSTASRAHARVISVVLIDADPQRMSAMAAGFRATGCEVIEAPTPLEAIVRLWRVELRTGRHRRRRFANGCRRRDGTFVEREHPDAKLITIGDEIFHPDGFANWLSSANPNADLPARVREAHVAPRRRR